MSKKEVDQWFAKYDNPMKPVVQRVREILLAAGDRIEEVIKWQSPTFIYKGNLASFNPRSKKHASLMFHTGAKIPGKFPHLEGSGDTARYLAIPSLKEAEALKKEIQGIVEAWIKLRDSE
ncbi:MAG TPA: DUF1801 domain-containing protein [Anaerolineales bacterium]|jgi:hypothetical protein|nr:DUF1801 domain-containing protein [Anaerolineales bacterium]